MNTRVLVNGTYDLPLTQTQRRLLVLLESVAVVIPLMIAVSGVLKILILSIIAIVFMLISMVCHTRLAMSIQNIAQVNPKQLDERQRAARDRAFVLSLRILGILLTIAWVYAMAAMVTGWWLPEAKYLGFVLWGFGMQVYSLPTAIAAWLQPDPILED